YNLSWLLGNKIDNTGSDISFDSAPSFYINGQPQAVDATGNVVVNPVLRDFERAAANLKAFDPYLDATQLTPVARYLVDAPTLGSSATPTSSCLRTPLATPTSEVALDGDVLGRQQLALFLSRLELVRRCWLRRQPASR